MFHHRVGATTSDTEQSHYPRGCHLGIHTGFFCPSPVLLHGSTFRPLFCTTLLSPAQWIFYEPGNVGFCVEDRNINMAFLHLELLFLLWYKIFLKTVQIGQVATWTALFMSLFLSKGADFMPASLCQTPDVQSTTCTTTWLDEEKKKRERERKLSGIIFPSEIDFCRGCRIAYFHPVSLGKIAHIYANSLSSLSEFTWSHIGSLHCFCMCVLSPAAPIFPIALSE